MHKPFTFIIGLLCLILVGCATPIPTPAPVNATPVPPTSARKSGTFRYLDLNTPDLRDVPVLIALDTLRAQGYTIEHIPLTTTSVLVEALARGDGEIAASNTQGMWTGIAKGANVRSIVQKYTSNTAIVSKQEIKTCRDLHSKSVASSPPTQLNPTLLSAYIEKTCPGTRIEFVAIPDSSARAAALLAGSVDAAIVETQFALDLERQAPWRFHTLISLAQEFPQVQIAAIHVRREWAEKNPEIVKDFVRALLVALRESLANPANLSAESVKRLALDPKFAQELSALYTAEKLWDANGGLTPQNLQSSLDFFVGIKSVPATLKLDDIADLSFLNAVLDEIGRK